MKKVLLFLVLFAAGLAVLRWIERPVAIDPVAVETLPDPFPPDDPLDAAEAPPAVEGEPPIEEGSLSVSGYFEYTQTARGRRVYDLVAQDSKSVGEAVELIDLVARVFDEETGEEVLEIRAASGRATLVQSAGMGEFEVRLDEDIALADVEATLLRDAPVVPLALRSKTLLGTLNSGQFRTDGRVDISGQGLTASGVGFEFLTDRGIVRFLSEGSATVEVESGRTAALSCDGELSIESPPEDDRRIALDARENARVRLAGREDFELDAEHVRIEGRPRSGGSDPFGFDSIVAVDSVRLATTTSEFRSERAEIELEGSTSRYRARLIGKPEGRMVLSTESRTPFTELADSSAFFVSFRGVGPLEITRTDALSFDLPGPAELDWKGARLTAQGSIAGDFGPVADDAVFLARGEVVIVRADGALETEEFQLRHESPPGGESRVTASANGPTRLSGDADAEHSFVLLTGETIDFALDGESWRVPRALGVDLTVDGPRGFVAKAAEVADFSVDPFGLEALGDVSLDAAEGALRGSRLIVRGPEQTIVEGTADEPAVFRSERGEWIAQRVERSGNLIIAEGVERASFDHENGDNEISCRRLLVSNESSVNEEGVLVESTRFTARDQVEARSRREEEALSLACDQLEGVFERRHRDDEFLWSGSTLTATGNVKSRFSRRAVDYDLSSSRMVIERTDRSASELSSANLVASGNVIVESRGETWVRGEGDELEVDKLGRGRLVALEDGMVRAEGVLPGTENPFTIRGRWIQFSDSYLAAAEPEIDLWLSGDEVVRDDSMHMRGRAERLEAERDGIRFLGRVRLESVDEGPDTWVLSADRARMEARHAAGDNVLAGLSADGEVAFRLGSSLVAYGDEFSVRPEQKRVRVVGDPARVFHQGLVWSGKEFEYDLIVHVLSATEVEIGPGSGANDR